MRAGGLGMGLSMWYGMVVHRGFLHWHSFWIMIVYLQSEYILTRMIFGMASILGLLNSTFLDFRRLGYIHETPL